MGDRFDTMFRDTGQSFQDIQFINPENGARITGYEDPTGEYVYAGGRGRARRDWKRECRMACKSAGHRRCRGTCRRAFRSGADPYGIGSPTSGETGYPQVTPTGEGALEMPRQRAGLGTGTIAMIGVGVLTLLILGGALIAGRKRAKAAA